MLSRPCSRNGQGMPDTSNDETRDSPYSEELAIQKTTKGVVRPNYDEKFNYLKWKEIFLT